MIYRTEICNGIFSTKLLPSKTFNKITNRSYYSNSKYFGLFVTIIRSKEFTLSEWPTNIHGCIGFWNDSYDVLTDENISNLIQTNTHQAMYTDSRSSYFPNFTIDPLLTVEISFMYNPKLVNKELETTFDNSIYGIIVRSETGIKSTFLPKVFGRVKWSTIKSELLKKGNIREQDNFKFWTYRTKTIHYTLKDVINKLQPDFKIIFQKFIFSQMKQNHCVPYEIRNGMVSCSNDIIRNLSVLEDMITIKPRLPITERELVFSLIKNYTDDIETKTIQEKSFLLPFIKKKKYVVEVVNYLFSNLTNLVKNEREFTFNHLVISVVHILTDEQKKVIRDIYLNTNILSIFQWCWDLRVLQKLVGKRYRNVYNKYVSYIILNFPSLDSESNYLVVSLEGIKILLILFPNSIWSDTLHKIQLVIFNEIMNRLNKLDGYVLFLDKTARFDITSHFLNGC